MKKILLSIILLLSCFAMNAQKSIIPSGAAVCPNEQISYHVALQSNGACAFFWEVTGGTFVGGVSSGTHVTVIWSSSQTQGKLTVTAQSCTNSSDNGVVNQNVAIKSLANTNLGSITGPTSLNVNILASRRYSIPLIQYPRSGLDPNPFFVRDYVWTVPSGWSITSQGISITDEIAFIDVTPDCCNGGLVTVKAQSMCGNYFSNVKQLSITRFIPNPGPISSSTGSMSVMCQSQTPVTYSISPVTGATSYQWTLPSGWTGASSSTSIVATPNGINGGQVTVRAHGGGLVSTTSTTTITMRLWNPNSPPSISGTSPVCYAGKTFTLSNLPSYGTVNWTQSPNLVAVSGQGTTNYTVRASSTQTSGTGWVEAIITTPCGTAPGIRYNVWVGLPYDFLVIGPTVVPAGSYNNYSAVEWNGQPSFSAQGVNGNGFTWSFGYPPTSAGWNCFGCAGQTNQIQAGSQSTYVTAHVANQCGSTLRNCEVFVECPTNDCVEPFFVYPNPSSSEIVVSPILKYKSGISEISITDSNGSIVYSEKVKESGPTTISVKGFKNGTYLLTFRQNDVSLKQRIVIKH